MAEVLYSDPATTIWHADALSLPLLDASVDLVVTSPPYFGLRSYQDDGLAVSAQIGMEGSPQEFLDSLLGATREMARVLKPSGSIFVNLGDRYSGSLAGSDNGAFAATGMTCPSKSGTASQASRRPIPRGGIPVKSLMGLPWRYANRCVDELRLTLRAEIIWRKLNPVPDPAKDRAQRRHEHLFHFTRAPHYYAQEEAEDAGSVWDIPTQPLVIPESLGVSHFAAFPLELPRRIVSRWCPPAGVVLDPFGGTGTVALMARTLDRRAIHVDLSRDYCRLAQWRVTDPGERAKAMQVEKPPAAPDGMDSLLDLLEGDAA